MKYVAAIIALMIVTGCGERVPFPTEGYVYDVAVKAVQDHPELPQGAVVGRKHDSEFYIGKSGATVVIPYKAADGATGSFSVWLADYHHDWVVTRCIPTPRAQ